MSDLISREELIDKIEIRIPHMIPNVFGLHDVTAEAMVDFIKKQPSVDAVQVVHCKDCTQWGCGLPMETDSIKCCGFGGYMVGKEGYCVYGQKKS